MTAVLPDTDAFVATLRDLMAEQEAAMSALAFKNDVLWSMLDAIDSAHPDR